MVPENMDFKVKVAVRVRPSDEETALRTSDKEVEVLAQQRSASLRSQSRSFVYDRVFASETTQREVYNQFGQDMVDHALEGYNACIFAYGQTGSGKSHTMLGTSADPGLIPQICDHLFQYVGKVRTKAAVTVRVSFLEIYNEQIRDLLVSSPLASTSSSSSSSPSSTHNSNTSLKIRGVEDCYVMGLSEYKVGSVSEVLQLLQRGAQNRATAATKMNDTSSRSHAVVSLTIKQQLLSSNTDVQEKISVLRLVDLAGSERAGMTGATGERLKEGGNINKSLVTLGRVISTLAETSSKGGAASTNRVVPYRDSVLTRLLQTSLGGNSRTAMIACVSPAQTNIDQTLSTLRYADQAKRITTSARINEDLISNATQEARLQQMQQELADLRRQLSRGSVAASDEGKFAEDSKLAKLVQFYEDEAERERVRSNLLEQQRLQTEKRYLDLADYVREISGQGLSSIDLRDTDSFERLMDVQHELEADITNSHSALSQSINKWRALVK